MIVLMAYVVMALLLYRMCQNAEDVCMNCKGDCISCPYGR